MDLQLKDHFLHQWQKYFAEAELPLTFYSSDKPANAEIAEKAEKWNCFIGELAKVRNGRSIAFGNAAIGCGGGKRYLGFSNESRPGFEYFLSCGNEETEGERYLQSPELVKAFIENTPWIPAASEYLVFKRWDQLTETDQPEVVIFFASPDVLSGLFTLAGFDRDYHHGAITPFGAGCASIVQYPLAESRHEKPRAVIGMFDVSARPWVPPNVLTFAVPFKRFVEMVSYMDESFLITKSWEKVKRRIAK
jgi:uncharacterized protein (DUF169 family)